tara:strand:+ start:288 stop:440 length:153 start_codon:yes stop_codon:yes gene_type:complete
MTRSTEARKNQIRKDLVTCDDLPSLLVDVLHDNERLRGELRRWEQGKKTL